MPSDGAFIFLQVGARSADHAGGIEKQFAPADFNIGKSFGFEGGGEQFADADAGGAGSDHEESLVSQRMPGHSQSGKNSSQCHGSSALDIVVEAGQAAGVLMQQL